METPSNPKTEDYTYKQGQYSPRKKKDTTPKVNPQLAVELVFQELKRVEAYTRRIEDATAKKVEIDMGSLESAENRLKSVLADFERQGNRMKNGSYVDKKVSMYSILCAVFSLSSYPGTVPRKGKPGLPVCAGGLALSCSPYRCAG